MPATERLRAALDDRYHIEREIGAGGMATVYLARDRKHDREVALKVLRPDLSAIIGAERFLAEVRITAQLDHPHILVLIDSGITDGILYYVLPYVRGESLRAKLTREKQLSLDEALSVTKQIASALDYAHRHGVVHRDIKPENILLHEGEAMLADFGIALAVKEAGGNRLTETGLSLGTPQYMSPEQATGDRTLDSRSDVYSLGAVFYEMVAGEPPVTGATAQAIIAKLLTERPTGLRVVRNTVPPAMERAAEKALAKVPADRFKTAGEFAAALEAAVVDVTQRYQTRTRSPLVIPLAATAALLIAAIIFWTTRNRTDSGVTPNITLRDRTQLTTTGHARSPAISGDGKSLAYIATNCRPAGCTYGIEIQDVGGSASRRLYDGATAIYDVVWSPDRRNVLFMASIGGRFGSFVLSAIGGTPRQVSPNGATFFAGGDSVIATRPLVRAENQWLLVSALDGVVRDSIRVAGASSGIGHVTSVPNSKWILVHLEQPLGTEWRVLDRQGREQSRLKVPSSEFRSGFATSDALFISLTEPGTNRQAIVRHALELATGKLNPRGDTVYTGTPTAFSATEDGSALVVDEGTTEYGLWVLDVNDAVKGIFPEQKRLTRSTTAMTVHLSPDGKRVLVSREAQGGGSDALQFYLQSTSNGVETPIAFPKGTNGSAWSDNENIVFAQTLRTGTRLSRMNVATHAITDTLTLADSVVSDWEALPQGGWVWIPSHSRSFRVQRTTGAAVKNLVLPPWYLLGSSVLALPSGRSIAYWGWKAPDEDSLGFGVVSLDDAVVTHWFAAFGESAALRRTNDDSFLALIQETLNTYTLYRLRGPGSLEKLGTIPRPIAAIDVSADLRRVAFVSSDYRGDAWLYRVVKH